MNKVIPHINFESFINSLYEGIVYQDAEGEIVFCNKAAQEILGLTAEQLMGRNFIMHPDWRCFHADGSDFPGHTHPSMTALQTGQPQRNVVIGVHKPGDELNWILINVKAEPIFIDNSNKPSGVITSFVDITEQKTSELKIDKQNKELVFQNEEKEKRAAELIIANKELVFQNEEKEKRAAELIIANKELVFQNEEKEKRAAELIIANKELVFQNEEKEKRAAELIIANKELVFQNEEKEKRAAELIIANKELVFQNEEKEKRAAELGIANKELLFQNEEKEKRATELIIANKEILASEKLLVQSQEMSHIGSWEWDIIPNSVFWTDELYRIFGFAPKEFDITFEDYLKYIHPDDKEIVKNVVQQAYNDHKPYSFLHRIIRPDGDIRMLNSWGEVEVDENGHAVKMKGVAKDVTEIKKTEEKLNILNRELIASNKELEQFAYVVSHDLQEPVRMVGSFLNLLVKRMEGQLDESTQQYIHFAVDGAERMKIMIQDLLKYSRLIKGNEKFSETDLNEAIAYTTRLLQEEIKKNQAVITGGPMPVIAANKTLITQLFVNMVSNALKYHSDKKPEIEIGYTEDTGKYIFYVKDNGIGIDPKFFDKIFIIFQRLHNRNEYSGTGIGLSICKKIVDIHKGKIWLESEAGRGSTFYFSIPKHII